jgi:Flp pilus assembly protein TadG
MSTERDRGQATVLTVLFLAVLLGVAALAIDVGTWYKQKRDLQAVADAAALAGAQALPEDPATATSLALQYASTNGLTLSPSDITFSNEITAHDTINVHASSTANGVFAKLFGIDTLSVGAAASARSDNIDEARYAAPVAVNYSHPYLSGSGCPCFGRSTTLDLTTTGPGAFRLINIDGSRGGTSPGTLAGWMQNGLDSFMGLGWYYSDPGAKFNSSQMQSALGARTNSELLFPVYDAVRKQGANFQYDVIGWVGFYLTGFDARGNSGQLYGYFTRVIWQGLQGQSGGSSDLGVRAVQLVN